MGDDELVAGSAWGDDVPREYVGVDDGQVMGGGEAVGDGGFARGNAAGQTDHWESQRENVARGVTYYRASRWRCRELATVYL